MVRVILKADRSTAALTLATVAGVVSAVHGTAGLAKYWQFAVPQGWVIAVLVGELVAGRAHAGTAPATVRRRLLWSTLPVLGLQQLAYHHDHQRADAAVICGWFTLLIALELAQATPGRLARMVHRLNDREALEGASPSVDDVVTDLDLTGHRWAVAGSWALAAVFVVTWSRAGELPERWADWSFGPAVADQVLIVAVGAVAGGWLGRMIGYGRLSAVLAARGLRLRVGTAHPDGAGGLKPVGDFYLYQSLVASLPAVFLAVWSLVVSLGATDPALGHYRPFLAQYLWLLVIAIGFEIAVFAVPLWSVHVTMRTQKIQESLPAADRLSPAIAIAWRDLGTAAPAEQETARRQLGELLDRYHQFEQTPTWPIDPVIRRRFTTRTLGLFTPFIGYVLSETDFWHHLLDGLPGGGT